MVTFTLAVIAASVVLGLGIPLMERLLRKIRPLTPKQEQAEYFREQARRRLDRIPR